MFSAAVKLVGVDDFLENQECKPNKKGMEATLAPSIPLGDCLACSGCVTEVDTAILHRRSMEDLREAVQRKKLGVVSLSAQSIVLLAAHYKMEVGVVMQKLAYYFKVVVGVGVVLDMEVSDCVALLETAKEFEACLDIDGTSPFMVSHCPGFVMYMEKTATPKILGLLSRTKSSQQIQGYLVKTEFLTQRNQRALKRVSGTLLHPLGKMFSPEDTYHVCVMPCYDKKLEAVRASMSDPGTYLEVDAVLTTGEVIDDILATGTTLESLPLGTIETLSGNPRLDHLSRPSPNSESGGYAQWVSQAMSQKLGCTVSQEIDVRPDWKESRLTLPSGFEVRFVRAYDFKNVYNILRNIDYSGPVFYEVMACPKGCINGGGQQSHSSLSGGPLSASKREVRRGEIASAAGLMNALPLVDSEAFADHLQGISPGALRTEFHSRVEESISW